MNGLFVGKCRARALSFGACRGGAEVKGGHVASQSDKSDDIDVLLSVSADFLENRRKPTEPSFRAFPANKTLPSLLPPPPDKDFQTVVA